MWKGLKAWLKASWQSSSPLPPEQKGAVRLCLRTGGAGPSFTKCIMAFTDCEHLNQNDWGPDSLNGCGSETVTPDVARSLAEPLVALGVERTGHACTARFPLSHARLGLDAAGRAEPQGVLTSHSQTEGTELMGFRCHFKKDLSTFSRMADCVYYRCMLFWRPGAVGGGVTL